MFVLFPFLNSLFVCVFSRRLSVPSLPLFSLRLPVLFVCAFLFDECELFFVFSCNQILFQSLGKAMFCSYGIFWDSPYLFFQPFNMAV